MAEMDASLLALMPTQDPAAADNSYVAIEVGPSPTATPSQSVAGESAPDVATILARLQELERVNSRHGEQMVGARGEVQRWQTAFQEQQRTNQDLLARVTTLLEQRTATAPLPAEDLAEDFVSALEAVTLDGKKEVGKLFAEKWLKPKPTAPSQEVMTSAKVHEIVRQSQQTMRTHEHIIEDLALRHHDIVHMPEAREAIVCAYNALVTDPRIQTFYGTPPETSLVTINGTTWDARLLDRALGEVRQQRGVQAYLGQAQQTVPTQGGGPQHTMPRPKDQVVLPAEFVRGEHALLNDPRIQAAMTVVTGHKDPRSHAKHLYDHAPDADKVRWQQQAALTGR